MCTLKALSVIAFLLVCPTLLGQFHLHREANQAAKVRTGPSPRRISFPNEPSRTTVVQAYQRMVSLSGNEEWKRLLLTMRQHAPNLVWDLQLQRAAIKLLTNKGAMKLDKAKNMLRQRRLEHFVGSHWPTSKIGDLNARFSVTSSGLPIPIPSPAPGAGPGPANRSPIRGDELREMFQELFIKGGLHGRLVLEIKEARHFVNNHVRYLKDRQCFKRQRFVEKAIAQFRLDYGRLPRGGYKALQRSLRKGGYVKDDKLFQCVVGIPYQFDKQGKKRAISCSRHGWYGDWHSGPPPYDKEKARGIFSQNAVVWAFLREYSCQLRRRALARTIRLRTKGKVTLARALAISDELEHSDKRNTFCCPLDNRPFSVISTSLNNRSDSPFAIHCGNHSVTVETGPEDIAFPKMDETAKVKAERTVPREPVYNSLGMKMVWIDGGTFLLGSPNYERERTIFENPRRRVTIKDGFWMSECELTRKQYYELTKPKTKVDKPHHPMASLSFLRALEFCQELTKRERSEGTLAAGLRYSLPSEAQWEYACRANSETPFWTGQTITTGQANFDGRSPYGNSLAGIFRRQTTAVKSFAPNPFELYDMAGNVAEWTIDTWSATYEGHPTDGSPRQDKGSRRTVRGGSWREGPASCRSAARRGLDGSDWTFRCQDVGLRLVIVEDQ